MNIKTAFKSNRLMKSLTGMTINEINNLTVTFTHIFETNRQINHKKNKKQRQLGGGRKHKLSTTLEKLFFILFYIKCYPTFDLAGFYFDVNRSQTLRWTQALLPILEQTLGHNIVLPKRQIHTKEEFAKTFPEIKDLFIDGVERPINKPKNKKQNRKNYSGKKKRHVKKNIIVSNDKKEILFLSPTGPSPKNYTLCLI
jgi:ribosome-associated translation inhibitor RaiA